MLVDWVKKAEIPGTISMTDENNPTRVYIQTLNGMTVHVRSKRELLNEPLSDEPALSPHRP